MDRRLALIVNPSAGGGRAAKVLPGVEDALGAARVRTDVTTSLDHAQELARAAAGRGEIPVTLGGDGLVGAVAAALRGEPDPTMGVLPGGRGNDFCRVAGIGQDPVAACRILLEGAPRPIDVGDVDGATFIGIASFGFDSDANRIANEAPSALGPLVYAYGALRAVARWRPARYSVAVDGGEPVHLEGWSVVCANSAAYGGGMWVAPDARLDDGLLDVVLIGDASRGHFLRTLPKVFKGRHVDDPSVQVLRGRSVRVDADRPFVIYADGDPIGQTPATVSAVPGAVRVLLPA